MPWAKIDDGFWGHPKIVEVGNAAAGVLVRAISYCSKHLTDGRFDRRTARYLDPKGRQIGRLLASGLVAETVDGWQIVDYLDYNPSREQVLRKREEDLARKSRSGGSPEGFSERKKSVPSHPIPSHPVPNDERDRAATLSDVEAIFSTRCGGTIGGTGLMWVRKALDAGVTVGDLHSALDSGGSSHKYLAKAAMTAAETRRQISEYEPRAASPPKKTKYEAEQEKYEKAIEEWVNNDEE